MDVRTITGPVCPFEAGTREAMAWASFDVHRRASKARATAASQLDRRLIQLRHQLARRPGDQALARELAEAEGRAVEVEAADQRALAELEQAEAELLAVVAGRATWASEPAPEQQQDGWKPATGWRRRQRSIYEL